MISVGTSDKSDPKMNLELRPRGEETDLCREGEIPPGCEEQQQSLCLPITCVCRDHPASGPTFRGREGEIRVHEGFVVP